MTRKNALIKHKLLETIHKTYPKFKIYNPSYFSYQSNNGLYHVIYLGKEIACSPYLQVFSSGFGYINYSCFDMKEDVHIISMEGRTMLRAKKIIKCENDAFDVSYIDMQGKRRDVELSLDVVRNRTVYIAKNNSATGMRAR